MNDFEIPRNEEEAEKIVSDAFEELLEQREAIDVLLCKYSPICGGINKDALKWIRSVLQKRGIDMMSLERTAMRMRNYRITIRKLCEAGGELEYPVNVLALSVRHACERAAEQFADQERDLYPKQWYISQERIGYNE